MKKNQEGVALFIVISALVLLSTIMINFTYESKINKLRAYSFVDSAQAKLSAEAGLRTALARLRIYKEIYNQVQKNSTLKTYATPELLGQIWNLPFIYPIPQSDNMTISQKELANDFSEESILQGEFEVYTESISTKLNLNMLRITFSDQEKKNSLDTEQDEPSDSDNKLNFEAQLVDLIKNAMEKKKESDPDFYDRYSNIEPELLVGLIRYYISDPNTCDSPYCTQAESEFQKIELKPKGAPMVSMEELHLLPLWNSDLIGLISNEVSVHPILMINLDTLTASMLKLLFPSLTQEDIDGYFEWKNNPDDPIIIYGPEDLKTYFITENALLEESEFDKRFEDMKSIGIQFGPDPNLFKITSVGKFRKSTITIEAIVVLPLLPPKPEEKSKVANQNEKEQKEDQLDENDENKQEEGKTSKNNKEKKTYPQQLLNPRVIEYITR